MEWAPDTELHQMQVVAAPYGGPMAIVRDSTQFIKVGGSTVKPIIRIFTASGHLLASINVRIKLRTFLHFVLFTIIEWFGLKTEFCSSGTVAIC